MSADDLSGELNDVLFGDVRGMLDRGEYESAFAWMNQIFVLLGEVVMDDLDGGTGIRPGDGGPALQLKRFRNSPLKTAL